MISKFIPLFPTIKSFKYGKNEGLYYTLMMSTGLTFGTISALFGLTHGVIDDAQYSYIVATVIGSAVVPTMAANAWFLPKHLLPRTADSTEGAGSEVVSLPTASSGN